MPAGPVEDRLLRAVGRLLHVDDHERIDVYRVGDSGASTGDRIAERPRAAVRSDVSTLTSLKTSSSLGEGVDELWAHPQVRRSSSSFSDC